MIKMYFSESKLIKYSMNVVQWFVRELNCILKKKICLDKFNLSIVNWNQQAKHSDFSYNWKNAYK